MKPNFHIRSLLLAVLLGSNILVFILSGISLQNSRDQHQHRAETLTENVAKAVDQSLSNSIDKIDISLLALADELQRQLGTGSINEHELNTFMARQEQRLPEVEAFRVSNAEGLVILGKGLNKKDAPRWSDRDYFTFLRDSTNNPLFVTKPIMGKVAKKLIIGFNRRYNYPDGSFAGIISAPIALSHFSDVLAKFNVGANGTIVLRDAELGLITRFPEQPDKPVGQLGNKAVSPELQKIAASGIQSTIYFTPTSADGFERIVSFNRLSKVPMIFIVGVASEDYLADWRNELTKTLALALSYLLLSLILGAYIFRLLKKTERDELALKERELRLKTIIDNEPECIKLVDASGRLIEMNPAGLAMIEAESLDAVVNQPVLGLIAPEFQSAFSEMHHSVISGHPARMEFEIRGLKGGRHLMETHAVPMRVNNEVMHLAITRDITQRKVDEIELVAYRRHLEQLVEERTNALMDTEARASHIVQSSADGLYGVDTFGKITFINPAACDLLGYTPDEVIGRNGHTLFHHSKLDGTAYPVNECPSHNALKLGQKVRVDNEVYWHADGHPVPVMYAIHPIVQDGHTNGAVISFVDMSEQRSAAQARERALIAAENLARVRSEFLANMSHEIRTPLNGILGFAEIGLRNYENSEKARNALSKIALSGKRLLGIINDILDFSKIEAGKLSIEKTNISIHEIVASAIELVRDRAESKHLGLHVTLAPDIPETCLGDPLRIGQVLLNVLSNAIKFTEQGEVTLSVHLKGTDLVFKATDSGIGMTEAQMSQLFTPFHQADASATRRFGGTGLGLAISKQILELMNGEIKVSSQFGVGTSVEFRLPCQRSVAANATQAIEPATTANSFAGLSFLVAEDEPINREILRENLIEDGANVVMVTNGREAVERIMADGRDAYDVILMDLQMPEMNGYEATQRILELAPDLPIIAQTAHAFDEERDKCLAAGMVGHVSKPLDSNELLALINQYVKLKPR